MSLNNSRVDRPIPAPDRLAIALRSNEPSRNDAQKHRADRLNLSPRKWKRGRLSSALWVVWSFGWIALAAPVSAGPEDWFIPWGVDYPATLGPYHLAVGDLDNDGDLDLAVANADSDLVRVFLNLGNGTFAEQGPALITGDGPRSLAIGDLDRNGSLDVAVAHELAGNVAVLLNNGDATFTQQGSYSTGNGPFAVAIGDLNGDTWPDLVVANSQSNSVSVLSNLGNGAFSGQVSYDSGSRPFSVAIGDLDGDGWPDLAVANSDSDTVSVLRNLGNGVFPEPHNPLADYPTGDTPRSVAISDLNADGALDLVAANLASDTVSALRNLGNGDFAPKVDYPTGSGPRFVAVGDLNGDGMPDLAVANSVANTVSVLTNLGEGDFPLTHDPVYDYPTRVGPYSVAIGDLDGDQRADLAVTNLNADVVRILRNQALVVAYVRAGLTTGANDGRSWSDAFHDLQSALATAGVEWVEQIWVAEGTYRPDETAAAPMGTGDRNASFNLITDVAIYGGFAGTETDLSQRGIAAHPTTLSGDLAEDDSADSNLGDNSLHVVTAAGVGDTAVIDGFTISGGNADGAAADATGGGALIQSASPGIRSCRFAENRARAGGAAAVSGASHPDVIDCEFVANAAFAGSGGAMIVSLPEDHAVRLSRCTFLGNRAQLGVDLGWGGAIHIVDGGVEAAWSAFTWNTGDHAGAVYCGEDGAYHTAHLRAVNCSFVGNDSRNWAGGAIYFVRNSVPSLLANCQLILNGNGCVVADDAPQEVSIVNCSIVSNVSWTSSAVRAVRPASVYLLNSLVWRNYELTNPMPSWHVESAQIQATLGGYLDCRWSTVENWSGTFGVLGCNGVDPGLVRLPSFGPDGQWDGVTGNNDDDYGDLRLLPSSAVIDSADSDLVPADALDTDGDLNVTERLPLDLSGFLRLFDTTNIPDTGLGSPPVDRGAFENNACDTCPGERLWINPNGGSFEDFRNWILGVPPPGQPAAFNLINFVYTVAFNSNRTNSRATIRAGEVTFDLNGFTYTLNGSFSEGALTVGESVPTPATLRITEGTVNATGITIGHEELADGLIDVGAGSILRAGPHLFVGSAGTGALNIHDGGLVTANTGAVGSLPGSYGSVDITGTSSRLSFLAFCLINNGIVNVGQDATFRTGFGCFIQGQGMLTGSGTVLGDVINIGGIEPGSSPGTLTITGDLIQFSDDPKFGNGAGSLTIELAGDTPALQDHLAVSGLATLGGGLIVERAANFDGPLPQDVEVLSASSINGFFDVAFLPHAGDSQRYLSAQTQAGLRGVGQSVVITSLPLTAFINTDPASPTGINGTPSAAATGDLDGDGDLDVAAVVPRLDGNSQPINGDVVILRNEGLSMGAWQGFAAVQLTGVTGRDPRGIAAADLDGQPGLDLVIADAADDTVSVLLNTGTGAFQPRTTFSVGDEPRAVVVADLDADGYFDVATANTSGGSVSVLRNQEAEEPGGTWAGLGQTLGDQRVDVPVEPSHADPRPVALAAVQLNSDAGEELAVANEGASSITVLRNDSSLRSWFARWYLPPPVRLPTPRPPTSIEPENMDEDKWDDIVYASATGGTAGIILNDRAGADEPMDPPDLIRFRPAVEVPTGSNPTSIVGADLDQDLDTDLAIATTDESSARVVRVLRNDAPINGVVTLSPDQDISAGADPRIVLAGNVDGVEGEPNPSDDLIVLGVGVIASRASKDAGGFGMLTGVPQPDGARVFRNIPPKSPTPPCAGDANGDNAVNFADITSVVVNWGTSGLPGAPLPGDADHSGSVNFADITAVLVEWGAACG